MNILITGGAGFIGSNSAVYFLRRGDHVTIFDNLSRAGAKNNLEWIRECAGNLTVIIGDVRSATDIKKLTPHIATSDVILHLAGQVAVTTSVTNPQEDFDINAIGTMNVLESMRRSKSHAKLLYSSTNKVYGIPEDIEVVEKKSRYAYAHLPYGITEKQKLDFHSPYGCSKGAADQYVHDYSRIYNLDTVVFRQSCIYGPRQFGMEDQGWVAWFIIAAMLGKKLDVYGNGKQVRDLLYIDDLITAYELAILAGEKTRGRIYNIGGGPRHTISIWCEFGPKLEKLFGKKIPVAFHAKRPGDQNIFIADIRKGKQDFGWEPMTSIESGIETLYRWIIGNASLFS